MRNRSRSGTDPNVFASNLVRIIEEGERDKEREARKDPAAVALGRRGGLKGGAARAASMTPAQRSASAKKAARARWKKSREET
jgi:hypothetical protein